MKKYLVEFIGTFFLFLTIGLTVINPGGSEFAPFAIGFVLMVMIYSGGYISGAHYNPAVTVAVWIRGKCSNKDFFPYIIAQMLAVITAAQAILYLKVGAVITPINPALMPTLLAEFLFTFALAFVILNVATAEKTAGNSYYGLAIGSTVLAGAIAVGGISGGAFNPAVAFGLCLLGIVHCGNLWIYFAANLAGGIVAALTFNYLNKEK